MPFFEALKENAPFNWGLRQQRAFEELKSYLQNLTTLASPAPKEPLLIYVAASPHAVSAVLIKEQQEGTLKRQIPVYYASETLEGPKKFYIELEKIAYAVVMAARKPKHYFQANKITVPSSQPLDNIFKNLEAIRRIGKWATELNAYAITFVG